MNLHLFAKEACFALITAAEAHEAAGLASSNTPRSVNQQEQPTAGPGPGSQAAAAAAAAGGLYGGGKGSAAAASAGASGESRFGGGAAQGPKPPWASFAHAMAACLAWKSSGGSGGSGGASGNVLTELGQRQGGCGGVALWWLAIGWWLGHPHAIAVCFAWRSDGGSGGCSDGASGNMLAELRQWPGVCGQEAGGWVVVGIAHAMSACMPWRNSNGGVGMMAHVEMCLQSWGSSKVGVGIGWRLVGLLVGWSIGWSVGWLAVDNVLTPSP